MIPQGDWGITAGESGAGDFVLNGGSVEVHSDMAAIFATDIKLKDGYLKAVKELEQAIYEGEIA